MKKQLIMSELLRGKIIMIGEDVLYIKSGGNIHLTEGPVYSKDSDEIEFQCEGEVGQTVYFDEWLTYIRPREIKKIASLI